MDNKGISLLYLSVGSGHQIAAESLANAIQKLRPGLPVVVEDPFAERTKILPKFLNALQAISTSLAPDLYDLAWRGKADYDSYQWLTDVGVLQDFLVDRLASHSSETIVATHVIPCILGVGLKKRSLIRNVFGVVTDFGAHSLWPRENVDSYFVASEEIKNTLSFRGIDPSTIHVTGIPIKSIPRITSRKEVAATPGMRVLLMAGGIQGGAYINAQRYVLDLLDMFAARNFDNIELTIVTGNQKAFRREIQNQVSKDGIPNVHVLGFVSDIPRLMTKNDILITKSGGLIISEALAVGICIILTEAGPGQERANYNFLARQGAAFKGDTPEDVLKVLEYLQENPKAIGEMKAKARSLGYPKSSETIAGIIANLINHQNEQTIQENPEGVMA